MGDLRSSAVSALKALSRTSARVRRLNECGDAMNALGPPTAEPAAPGGDLGFAAETAAVSVALVGDAKQFKQFTASVAGYAEEAPDNVAVQSGSMTVEQYVLESIARDLRAQYEGIDHKLDPVLAAVLDAGLRAVDWTAVAREIVDAAGVALTPAPEAPEAEAEAHDAPFDGFGDIPSDAPATDAEPEVEPQSGGDDGGFQEFGADAEGGDDGEGDRETDPDEED